MRTLYAYCESKANSKDAALLDGSEILIGSYETAEEGAKLADTANNIIDSFGEQLVFFSIDEDNRRYNGQDLHRTVLQGIEDVGYWAYDHRGYDKHDWMREVENQDTLQSYHQWVSSKLTEEDDSAEQEAKA